MAIPHPWDTKLIPSKNIKVLDNNRRYFIHEVNENRQFTEFTTLMRVLTTTSRVVHEQGSNSEMISSFFSEPLHCATQGLPIYLWKDRFMIHWNSVEILNIESFVVQILLPGKGTFNRERIQGITNTSDEIQELFEKKDEDLSRNLASTNILNFIFPANVRGMAILNPKVQTLNVRLLVITEDNKKLMNVENLEYLEWVRVRRKYLYASSVEPKSIIFKSMTDLNMDFCLKICYQMVMYVGINCEKKHITKNEPLVFENLKAKTGHQFKFYNCSTAQQLDELLIITGVESEFSNLLKFGLISFSDFRAWSCRELSNCRERKWAST